MMYPSFIYDAGETSSKPIWWTTPDADFRLNIFLKFVMLRFHC